MRRRTVCGMMAAAAVVTGTKPVRAQGTVAIKLALNPKFIAYLPVFVGVDKGYFKDAGIDLQVTKYLTSANDYLALVVRGDIDVMPLLGGPALYNGYAQNIDLKLLASTSETTTLPGYGDEQWVMVRKDLWDSGAVKKLADLRGKNFDAATKGSSLHVLGLETLVKAGLTQNDLNFTNKSTGPADQTAALVNHAVDVQCTTEPNATLVEQKGLAVKWIAAREVMPWFQDSYWGVGAATFERRRDALVRFLVPLLKATDDINRGRGKLTPEIVATIVKWSEIPPEIARAGGALPYFGQNGAIKPDTLRRLQQLWIDQKLVTQPVDVARIYDDTLLKRARTA